MQWQLLPFAELTLDTLYELMKLRVDIFVVEQNCPYPELDEKDRAAGAMHLLGRSSSGELLAYARLLPAGVSYSQVSIGRVAVAAKARGGGRARQLMLEAIGGCHKLWPAEDIKIGAQEYLRAFYQSLGFEVVSEVYLEDGIPHLDMLLHSQKKDT
ncbi:MAG: GNAT family N-acetyltransferase [Shewanella algae]|uniref:GNAT family N-acetyltransferase n=1 Tax=Shewanella TaxID=22 RepID=UPI0008DDC82F|nr:GNAT family N-acetyltransferase [Shewanella algae]NJI86696.1 GNAT family N-acetyltransferase [Shewanella sp. Iso12]MBO2562699.1 GNAT family N-acetyltransferase [Shewanella algae]MBO2613716.1 GNAT family N-acetyltransferase [Shewanella algae]MDC8854067.1 GNAT family N-acetyltransferase [Shewanella algae]OHY52346.1 GCN5 family acetyltransferase [Shewanella algae]